MESVFEQPLSPEEQQHALKAERRRVFLATRAALAPIPELERRRYLRSRRRYLDYAESLKSVERVADVSKEDSSAAMLAYETSRAVHETYPDVFEAASLLLSRLDALDTQVGGKKSYGIEEEKAP